MPVVDASVVVDWVAPHVNPNGPAGRLLVDLSARDVSLRAPRLLLEEVGNALITGIRRERWSGAEADRAWTSLRRLPVALVDDPQDLARAWELSRRYDEHPLYDMVYVAVAERLEDTLMTADRHLVNRMAGSEVAVLVQ